MAFWLVLLGLGGTGAAETAGGVATATVIRYTVSTATKEIGKKLLQEAGKKVAQDALKREAAKKIGQQATKTVITKTTQNGAVESIFTEAAQIESGAVLETFTAEGMNAARATTNAYRLFGEGAQGLSKMRWTNYKPLFNP